jgi:hypothetical protein
MPREHAHSTIKHGPLGRAGRDDASSSVAAIALLWPAPCVLASPAAITPDRRVVIAE